MQISIDTEKDSQAHIQHVIDLLQKIISSAGSSASSGSSESSAPFADLFGSPAPQVPSDPSTSNLLSEDQTSNQASAQTPSNTADLLASLNAPKEPAKVDVWGNPKKDDDTSFKVEVY